jgi:hypothetical protein
MFVAIRGISGPQLAAAETFAIHANAQCLREAGEAEPKPDERAEGGAVPPPAE